MDLTLYFVGGFIPETLFSYIVFISVDKSIEWIQFQSGSEVLKTQHAEIH